MEFLIIFFSYLVSGMIENYIIIRILLTFIFSLSGIIIFSVTKGFLGSKEK